MTEENAGMQPVKKATEINGNMPPIEPAVEPVVQPVVEPTPEVSQEDPADVLAAKDAEIAKIKEDRDNYKRGMLKAKGKLKVEEDDLTLEDETVEDMIDRKVQESLYDQKVTKAQKEKDELITKTLKENKELRQVISNKPATPTSRGVSVEEENKYKEKYTSAKYWSPAQIADLEKRGLDPDVVYKNMNPGGTTSQATAPGQQ